MSIRDQLQEIERELQAIGQAVDVTLHASVLHTSEAAVRDQGGYLFCPPCRYIELTRRQAILAQVMHDPEVTEADSATPTAELKSPAAKRAREVEERLEKDAQEHAALRAAGILPAPLRNINPARGRPE